MATTTFTRKLILQVAYEAAGEREGLIKVENKDSIWSIKEVSEKLTQVPQFLENTWDDCIQYLVSLWELFIKKLDDIFPPETRSDTLSKWLHVGLTVVLPVVLGLLLLWCFCKCCCYCCCSGVGGRRRMMKAPGRRGALMSRDHFEGNTRGYFRNLRGKDSDFVF